MERDGLLQRMRVASAPNEISTALADARAWLREHPRDHQVALSMLELLNVERHACTYPPDNPEGVRYMRKIAVMMTSPIAFVAISSASALADSTEPPSPTNIVEGAGGAGGADATAFTGGDASTSAIVVVALVVVGLLALWIARRAAARTTS